ncbi:MAG: helix-turn-helix domain-containing protein [Solirubrobacteraceae bacterium]
MSIDTQELSRPLRADARRNRERVLKAARAVFSAKGRDAHLEDVARRAQVGVGTVYRHFPTKDALLEALAHEQFEILTRWSLEAEAEPDPWAAFDGMIWRGAELQASDRALMEAVAEFKPSVAQQAGELHASIERLLRRAQAAGAVRADATGADVQIMMCGLGSVMQMSGDGWRRYLTVMLDGLRA